MLRLKKLPPQKVLARYILLGFLVLLVVLFLWKNKSWFVAATVNGQPIPRWELEKRLVDRYGTQTLDEVINEQIILQEGRKRGMKVSDKDLAEKIAEIDKSLGGKITLKDALAGQGLSMGEFQKQIKLQLTLEKLAGASVVISDQEVADYVTKNRSTMTATDEAGLSLEAKNILLSQRKNDALRKLFSDLKSKAKVVKFL